MNVWETNIEQEKKQYYTTVQKAMLYLYLQ